MLYYKDLSEHVRRFRLERIIYRGELDDNQYLKLRKFGKKLSISGPADPYLQSKIVTSKYYKKRVVNKWHLLAFMEKNKRLIYYRKHKLKNDVKESSPGIFQKVKIFCSNKMQSLPCKRKETENF